MDAEGSVESGSRLASLANKRRDTIRQRRSARNAAGDAASAGEFESSSQSVSSSTAVHPAIKQSSSTGGVNLEPKKAAALSSRPASAPRERTEESPTVARMSDRLERIKNLRKASANRLKAKSQEGNQIEPSASAISSQSEASPSHLLNAPQSDPVAASEETIEPPPLPQSMQNHTPLGAQVGGGLDFRAIDPPQSVAVESSWDANKVLFNEYQDEKEKKDTMDVFEGDWLPEEEEGNAITFSSTIIPMGESEDEAITSLARGPQPEEEKKEKDTEGHKLSVPEDSLQGELDIYGWPKMEHGDDPNDKASVAEQDGDDEDLLPSSLDGDIVDESRVTKRERLEEYNVTNAGDDTSSQGDEDEDQSVGTSDEADDANVDEDVAYVPQQCTDLDEEDDAENYDRTKTPPSDDFIPSTDSAPTQFQIPVTDAWAKGIPPLPPRIPSANSGSGGIPPLGLSRSMPLPPPPPPPGSKKKKNRRSGKPSGGVLPLLAPPPPEKLKKWEEEKARPRLHLNATKGANSDASIERAQTLPVFLDDESMVSKASSASPEKSLSPASSSVVLLDVKMAEKVDVAISAASSKFEELNSPARTPSPASSAVQKVSGGAFVSWNLPSSPSADSFLQEGVETPQDSQKDSSSAQQRGETLEPIEITEAQSRETITQASPRYTIGSDGYPSPFELTVTRKRQVISQILDFLGDPVMVCRMKMLNKPCAEYVQENEYALIRDAVRLGGMNMHVRPYFWMWVTLEKNTTPEAANELSSLSDMPHLELADLERQGREGKWHSVIERDVTRSFGNLPPHKTGARLRTDSIVRALVSWGRCRMLKRGVKGGGQHLGPPQSLDKSFDFDNDVNLTPTDTVSDWGGVAPVGSFASLEAEESIHAKKKDTVANPNDISMGGKSVQEEMALNGNELTEEVRNELQGKLSCILHALAASHEDVGYCQGMDYIVAHLLRILQGTVRWKGALGTLPTAVKSAPVPLHEPPFSPEILSQQLAEIDRTPVVEETCFRIMECFFTTYGLSHFYYPELRCLKTCCRVFEKLIQLKLPVLADHFEHHELNVGLFALGWFQTLFLYLPSMPSATVCHMWDIWLVERSYKIFFRVGTAILFLSQPILLNHELEGMMGYLNTFPDATLLSPDILIACALQIKVTNRMLMDIEREVAAKTM